MIVFGIKLYAKLSFGFYFLFVKFIRYHDLFFVYITSKFYCQLELLDILKFNGDLYNI